MEWNAIGIILRFLSRKLSGGSLARSILVGILAVAIGLIIIKLRILSEIAKTYI